jgi:hypothetical protein
MMTTESSPLLHRGILLENTPELTRLQLRSRLSWPARLGLALPAIFGVFILGMVARALLQGGIQNTTGVVVATVFGAAFLVGPYLAARWSLYGVRFIVTPRRLIVRRHWTRGGTALDLALDQVRSIKRSESGIAIGSPSHVTEFETALTPQELTAVVDLLRQVIDSHLPKVARVSATAATVVDFAGRETKDGSALEFRYGPSIVVPILEFLVCLVVAEHSTTMGRGR